MSTVNDLIVEFKERPSTVYPEVLTLTEKNGFVRQSERFNKRLATEDVTKYKLIKRGDIAFNPYLLWAGAVAQNTIVDEGVISPLYPTFRVRPGIDPAFARYLLLSERMIGLYDTISFGSVPRRRRSSVSDFLALPVPTLPSLDEQRRIAAILDHASTQQHHCFRASKSLRGAEEALFQSTQGNATSSKISLREMGWDFYAGKNIASSEGVHHPTNRVIKVSAASSGIFLPGESKHLPLAYEPPQKHRIRKGDILFCRASGSLDLIGRTAVAHSVPDLYLPDKVWRLELPEDGKVDGRYALGVLRSKGFLDFVKLSSSGAAGVKNISKKKVLDFQIKLPSSELQATFSKGALAIDSQIALMEHRNKRVKELFSSLTQLAFRGEL